MKRTEQRLQTEIVVPAEEVDRFWSIVDRSAGADNCWPWTGCIKSNGYGTHGLRGLPRGQRTRHAHRLAYEFGHGHAPGAAIVCHSCDNPRCCNPAHLWLGTQRENVRDAMAKGRHVPPPVTDWPMIMRSRPHHWQRITAKQAVEIRARALAGEDQTKIGAEYGVNSRTVSKIKLGQRWAHV